VTEKQSLVSVVMPVWNNAAYVGEAIESILAQTHDNVEFIIVDDGSDDECPGIIADYATKDRRIKPLYRQRNPHLLSGAQARHAGIAIAEGEYIAAMDSDDIALPDRIAMQLAYMQAHQLDACGGQAEVFGASEGSIWFPETAIAIDHELVFRVAMLHPTMIVKADFMREVRYNEDVGHDDYEWQTRATQLGKLGNINQTVLRHRVHQGQSNQLFREQFKADLRRFRFAHIFRLFPNISASEYQILGFMAERRPLATREELDLAGEWLIRLSTVADPKLRARNLRRWHEICTIADYRLPKAEMDDIGHRIFSATGD